jgi:dihydroflavonol-4-reductase
MEEGLDAVIVNPSIVLGPGNWNAGSSRLFKTVWDGLRFYTKGVTGYVDVKDVVKAMLLLMKDENFGKCKNQRFLLNSENWSYQKLFNHIADALK